MDNFRGGVLVVASMCTSPPPHLVPALYYIRTDTYSATSHHLVANGIPLQSQAKPRGDTENNMSFSLCQYVPIKSIGSLNFLLYYHLYGIKLWY